MDTITSLLLKLKADFMRIGTKERIIITVILIIAFTLGIYLTNWKTGKTQNNTLFLNTPKAAISFTSNSTEVVPGEEFRVDISLDSGDMNVEAADFVVMYNPDVIQALTLDTGTFFKSYPKSSINSGVIQISGVAEFTDNTFVIPKGQGTIAQVTFRAIRPGTATIAFNPDKTIIASSGENITADYPQLSIEIQ